MTSHDPDAIDLDSLKEPPGRHHLLGTDNKGRDILARILHGGRISMGIAVASAAVSMTVGLMVGLCSGYFGGRLDTALMAVVDLVLSFPALLLAVGLSVLFPSGVYSVVFAIAAVGWASFARLIRGSVLSLRESGFMEAAEVLGCSTLRILFRHLLPQCIPLLLVMGGLKIGGFILTEASLSFLGLGAQPPTATWGSMVSAGRSFVSAAPWIILSPGLMIALTALCFNLLGDALRDKYGLKTKV
jgi:peptide/nickel transport system permease protein